MTCQINMCLCRSVRRLLFDAETIPTPYGPSVYRCYAFQHRYIITLIDAEIPSCTVMPSNDPSGLVRFETLEEFARFFDMDVEETHFERRREEDAASSTDTE